VKRREKLSNLIIPSKRDKTLIKEHQGKLLGREEDREPTTTTTKKTRKTYLFFVVVKSHG
jgi:hypothetical protein